MGKNNTPESSVENTTPDETKPQVEQKNKTDKKYFATLKRGLDSHSWSILLPKNDSPSAVLVAGNRTEVSKEVYDFINHPDRNKDIHNPQTRQSEQLFILEVE